MQSVSLHSVGFDFEDPAMMISEGIDRAGWMVMLSSVAPTWESAVEAMPRNKQTAAFSLMLMPRACPRTMTVKR